MADEYYLEDIDIYPYPNPALTEILLGEGMRGVVAEYGAKVESAYRSAVQAREHKRDPHPGLMESSIYSRTEIGGSKNDRWIAEVGSTAEYAASDELGRHSRAPYPGHHSLRDALYSVLPPE